MVKAEGNSKLWRWTDNVGGGDTFRMFDLNGKMVPNRSVRATRHRQGPCLTDVAYSGNLDKKVDYSVTTSINRSDDIVRGTYRLKMKVSEVTEFSRFVIFQVGSDTYNYTLEKKFAHGDVSGLIKEWDSRIGGNTYKGEPAEMKGDTPWFSLHDAQLELDSKYGCTANRGFVIRSWDAQLGGKKASPWFAERGSNIGEREFSTIDIVPPADTRQLVAGDYIDATIEYIVMPTDAKHYYGPNQELRDALGKAANTYHMIRRETQQNNHTVRVDKGTLAHRHPDLRVTAVADLT